MGRYSLRWNDENDENDHVVDDEHDEYYRPSSSLSSSSSAAANALVRLVSSTTEEEEEDENENDKDGPSFSQHSLSQQQQQQSQNSLPPIHYHVYFSDGDERRRRSCCSFCSVVGWTSVWVLLLSRVLYLYAPPMPPQQQQQHYYQQHQPQQELDSWTDFFNTQSAIAQQLGTTLVTTLQVVSAWCWIGIQDDVQQLYDNYFGKGETTAAVEEMCRLSLDFNDPTNTKKNHHHDHNVVLVGQEAVENRLELAMTTWRRTKKSSLPSTTSTSPLLLYALGGGTAVGKRYLARSIVTKYFENCSLSPTTTSTTTTTDTSDVILELDPSTINDEDDDDEDWLYDTIYNHAVRRYPYGSVVVLPHVEEWTSVTRLADLLSKLTTSPPSYPPPPPPLTTEDVVGSTSLFSNTIVLMTSGTVGKSILDKALRKYEDGSTIPWTELESLLEYEIRNAHQLPSSLSTFSSSTSMVVPLPFLPLNRTSLQELVRSALQRQLWLSSLLLQTSDSVVVSEAAINRLFDTTIEWQTWIQKTTGNPIVTFASRGARAIDPILDRLIPVIANCLSAPSQEMMRTTTNALIVLDWSSSRGGQFHLLECANENDKDATIEQDKDDTYQDCQSICQFTL